MLVYIWVTWSTTNNMQTQSVEWFLLRQFYFFAWSRQSTGKHFTMESILFWSNRNASNSSAFHRLTVESTDLLCHLVSRTAFTPKSNESFGSFEAYNQYNQMKWSYVYNVQKSNISSLSNRASETRVECARVCISTYAQLSGCLHGGRNILAPGRSRRRIILAPYIFSVLGLYANGCTYP